MLRFIFFAHQDQSIRIHKNLSPDCQVMLFSATYDKDVMDFAENIVPNPVVSYALENV
jgi:ATP-dependent RNA helicase DDX19/DBP5